MSTWKKALSALLAVGGSAALITALRKALSGRRAGSEGLAPV